MRCPSCRAELAEASPQCPHCKLTLRRLDTRFGAVPRHSLYVTDRSASLPLRDVTELRKLLDLFRRKFPQSLFSVFIMPRINGGTLAEYAFWLANRARFSSIEAKGAENFDVLLAIDLHTRAAVLQIGYGLENHLSENDLENALAQAASFFARNEIAGGVRACVDFMLERMREVVVAAEQEGKSARVAMSPTDW